jgi:hypothetical protein
MKDPHAGMHTPWGIAQTCDQVFEGCWDVTTAGHGGYKLSPALQRVVPKKWQCSGGWYEEDCEALIVQWLFFDLFPLASNARPQILNQIKIAPSSGGQGSLRRRRLGSSKTDCRLGLDGSCKLG